MKNAKKEITCQKRQKETVENRKIPIVEEFSFPFLNLNLLIGS